MIKETTTQCKQNNDILSLPELSNNGKRLIKILYGHGGEGKTYQIIQAIKNTGDGSKIWICSHSHKFLEELNEELHRARHIRGLSHLCPRLKDKPHYNVKIDKIHKLGLPNKVVCSMCKKIGGYPIKECPYNKQFNYEGRKIILSPIEYAFTNYIKEFEPDIIVVDDCMKRIQKGTTKQQLEEKLKIFQKHDKIMNFNSLDEFFSHHSFDFIIDVFKQFQREKISEMKSYVSIANITRICKQYMLNIDIEEFVTFRKYWQIYGNEFDVFAKHSFYPLFDYIFNNPKSKMIIIDAIPNKIILNEIANRYTLETSNKIEFRYQEIKYENSKIKNPTIFRCFNHKDSWYPFISSIKHHANNRIRIKRAIHFILDEFYDGGYGLKIGLVIPLPPITKKKLKYYEKEERNKKWLNKFIDTSLNVQFLTWGNLRGQNNLKDCNVLFVVGTYNINKEAMKEEFRLFFAKEPPEEEAQQEEYRYVFQDKLLDAFREVREEYEQYQGIMRGRGNQNVYCFSVIPKCLPDYFTIKDYRIPSRSIIRDVDEKWFINYFKSGNYKSLKEEILKEELKLEFLFSDRTIGRRLKQYIYNSSHFTVKRDTSSRYLIKVIYFKE